MKIAIIINEETSYKCTGKGCFKAFFSRSDAFSEYDENTEILGFTHTGGDFDKKIERLIDEGVDTIHLSTCLRGKNSNYEKLALDLSEHFNVVGYSHGSREGKLGNTVFYDKRTV
ncbi:MAG: CGGC domain-containing protein [Acidaminobacteraceae bacterium]